MSRRVGNGVSARRLEERRLSVENYGRVAETPEDGFPVVETPENHLQAVAPGMRTPEDRLRRLETRTEKK